VAAPIANQKDFTQTVPAAPSKFESTSVQPAVKPVKPASSGKTDLEL
jgi:hypothetical protein